MTKSNIRSEDMNEVKMRPHLVCVVVSISWLDLRRARVCTCCYHHAVRTRDELTLSGIRKSLDRSVRKNWHLTYQTVSDAY